MNTIEQTKRKFARICIQVNLKKTLRTHIDIGEGWYKCEYEGMNTICFTDGKFKQTKEGCKSGSASPPLNEVNTTASYPLIATVVPKLTLPKFRPWMQVIPSRRRQAAQAKVGPENSKRESTIRKGKEFDCQRSRFQALQSIKEWNNADTLNDSMKAATSSTSLEVGNASFAISRMTQTKKPKSRR